MLQLRISHSLRITVLGRGKRLKVPQLVKGGRYEVGAYAPRPYDLSSTSRRDVWRRCYAPTSYLAPFTSHSPRREKSFKIPQIENGARHEEGNGLPSGKLYPRNKKGPLLQPRISHRSRITYLGHPAETSKYHHSRTARVRRLDQRIRMKAGFVPFPTSPRSIS